MAQSGRNDPDQDLAVARVVERDDVDVDSVQARSIKDSCPSLNMTPPARTRRSVAQVTVDL